MRHLQIIQQQQQKPSNMYSGHILFKSRSIPENNGKHQECEEPKCFSTRQLLNFILFICCLYFSSFTAILRMNCAAAVAIINIIDVFVVHELNKYFCWLFFSVPIAVRSVNGIPKSRQKAPPLFFPHHSQTHTHTPHTYKPCTLLFTRWMHGLGRTSHSAMTSQISFFSHFEEKQNAIGIWKKM